MRDDNDPPHCAPSSLSVSLFAAEAKNVDLTSQLERFETLGTDGAAKVLLILLPSYRARRAAARAEGTADGD